MQKLSRFEGAMLYRWPRTNTCIRCTKGVHPHNQYGLIMQNFQVVIVLDRMWFWVYIL